MSNFDPKALAKFADGDVYGWLEQESSIMLKAVTSYGDPVEITAHDARQLAASLLAWAQILDDELDPSTQHAPPSGRP